MCIQHLNCVCKFVVKCLQNIQIIVGYENATHFFSHFPVCFRANEQVFSYIKLWKSACTICILYHTALAFRYIYSFYPTKYFHKMSFIFCSHFVMHVISKLKKISSNFFSLHVTAFAYCKPKKIFSSFLIYKWNSINGILLDLIVCWHKGGKLNFE